MERHIACLSFLLFCIVFIQAEPRVDVAERVKDINSEISKDKKLIQLLKIRGRTRVGLRRQDGDVNDPDGDQDGDPDGDQDGDQGVITQVQDEPKVDDTKTPLAGPNQIGVSSKEYETLSASMDMDTEPTFLSDKSRSLEVGDIITPEDMLVLAKGYRKQVKDVGEGEGIVSGSPNEFELADKLFGAYFMTLKRMVVIREVDINGLDALQALALNGKVVTLRSELESYTEAPSTSYKGFDVVPGMEKYGMDATDLPAKCHYKVIKKSVDTTKESHKSSNKSEINRRQASISKLKKTLGPNRKLVVNPSKTKRNKKALRVGRRVLGLKKKQIQKSLKENIQIKDKNVALTTTPKPSDTIQQTKNNNVTCRWKYNCTIANILRTCRLFPYCSNETDYYEMFLDPDQNLRRFRKTIGISLIDEEVEKIIELHVLRVFPPNGVKDEKVESLAKYFNDLVANNGEQTTPMTKENDSPVHPLADVAPSQENDSPAQNLADVAPSKESDSLPQQAAPVVSLMDDEKDVSDKENKDDEEARKMLGVGAKK